MTQGAAQLVTVFKLLDCLGEGGRDLAKPFVQSLKKRHPPLFQRSLLKPLLESLLSSDPFSRCHIQQVFFLLKSLYRLPKNRSHLTAQPN